MESYGRLLDKRDTIVFTMKLLNVELGRHLRNNTKALDTLDNLLQCRAELILVQAEITALLFP